MIRLVYSSYHPRDPETVRRHKLAQASWQTQPWELFPVPDEALPRLFVEVPLSLPYVGDILDAGVAGTPSDAIIVFLNSDIGVTSDCCLRLAAALQVNPATYAFRKDCHHRLEEAPPDSALGGFIPYAGTDLFAFRSEWWRRYRLEWPPMVLGREAWDCCLRVLMEATCPNKPVAVENCCWHERHSGASHWEDPRHRYTLPGQRHNLRLAKSFLPQYGYRPEVFGIR